MSDNKLQYARERVNVLKEEGKSGPEIAQALYGEHVHYEDAAQALRDAGFIASLEDIMIGVKSLHVTKSTPKLDPSDPLSALTILIPLAEPRALDEVVWWPDPNHPEATAERSQYRYPKDDPHWQEAEQVQVNKSIMGYVDVMVNGRWHRACRVQWSNPEFDKSKSDVLIEDPDTGWVRVWFYDQDVQPLANDL